MVISSLTQDINALPQFRASAIRALGTVVDSSMISGIERVIKQAIGDRNASVVSSALCTAAHFFAENREAVRRWLPEIQSAAQAGHGKTTAQYHALGLLYLIKQHDRMALCKLVQSTQSGTSHMLAIVLTLQIYNQLLIGDSSFVVDLKPFLRMKGKSDLVALEAARVICQHPEVYTGDVVFAITTLQTFLGSGRALLRFSALRILNDFAASSPQARSHVSVCNSEIEGLVGDSNRNVATLAITTLLKTGSEASVDRLIAQITDYVAEISDEFKITVVEAVRSLGIKFPNKIESMLGFLGSILREDGGLAYKTSTVDAICDLLAQVPAARDVALSHLCEFIEDSEYSELTAQILHLLGEEGPRSANPARIVRYIYNRLILEDSTVRSAAVGALAKMARDCPSLQSGVISILRRTLSDPDDDVRDRAVMSLQLLEEPKLAKSLLAMEFYDLDALEAQLCDYVKQSEAALSVAPFDISSVPLISKSALFDKIQQSQRQHHPGASFSGQDGVVPEIALAAGGITNGEASSMKIMSSITDRVPQLAEFGPVLVSSSKAEPLTEPESEYVVRCRKHICSHHIVLEFECHNTVRDLILSNVVVSVAIDAQSTSFNPVFTLPISRLPYDEVESCFVSFAVETARYPEATFECSLRFTATEIDSATGNPLGRGTQDEYSINSIALGMADYISARFVEGFAAEWSSLGNEVMETLQLTSVQNIREARSVLLSILNLEAHHESDSADLRATTSSLYLVGSLMQASPGIGSSQGNFAIRARFAMVSDGILAEVAVRSVDPSVSTQILGVLC